VFIRSRLRDAALRCSVGRRLRFVDFRPLVGIGELYLRSGRHLEFDALTARRMRQDRYPWWRGAGELSVHAAN
jgi:hypothetical protein